MKKGFTIVELIVVAAIIGLIASIVIARLDVSREKGRDTKKINELKSMQTAIELYQLDTGIYPQQPDGAVAKNNGAGLTSMTTTLQPVVDAKYLSSVPVPPRGSSVPGGDIYFYQTKDITGVSTPRCNGKTLADVPYIIYFISEQSHNLPRLENLNTSSEVVFITNGYCLTL